MKTAIFSIGVFLISLFLGSCQPSETSCSVVDTGKALDYKICLLYTSDAADD